MLTFRLEGSTEGSPERALQLGLRWSAFFERAGPLPGWRDRGHGPLGSVASGASVVETGVDPVTFRFSGGRSAD